MPAAIVGAIAMDDDRQRVHRLAVDQDIELDQRRLPVAGDVIVERRVAARDRFQPIVEIEHDFVERQLVGDQHAVGGLELERLLHAALVLAQLQDGADELRRRQDHRGDDRLFDLVDVPGLGQLRRAVDLDQFAVGLGHAIQHARRGGDQVHVEFALEPLLHDLHVQQAEEAAAEPEPERHRRFRLEEERRVVETQFLERLAELGILVALHRIEAREHHRLERLEAGERRQRRPVRVRHRVADLRVGDHLDAAGDEADFARAQRLDLHRPRREDAERLDLVVLPRVHQRDLHRIPDRAFQHADDDHHAAVGVVPRVENQRLERRVGVAFGRRQPGHDRLENVLHASALFGTGEDGGISVKADNFFELPPRLVGLRARQIDLVDDRDDLEIVVDREIGVGQRLRFDALRRIDQQQGALAGGQRARDFVAEVDVAGRIDQVEDVGLTVIRRIRQPHRMRLDRDAALALEVHAVEHLRRHLARLQRAGDLEKAVGQRRLAVVDMRDDGKIPNVGLFHQRFRTRRGCPAERCAP